MANDAMVDLSNTLDSAVCAQGVGYSVHRLQRASATACIGYSVHRREALAWAHVSIDPARLRP